MLHPRMTVASVWHWRHGAGEEALWEEPEQEQDNRAAQLHRKLMSPDRHRRRTAEEIRRGMEQKLARARSRRDELDSVLRRRMARAEAGRQVSLPLPDTRMLFVEQGKA